MPALLEEDEFSLAVHIANGMPTRAALQAKFASTAQAFYFLLVEVAERFRPGRPIGYRQRVDYLSGSCIPTQWLIVAWLSGRARQASDVTEGGDACHSVRQVGGC